MRNRDFLRKKDPFPTTFNYYTQGLFSEAFQQNGHKS